MSSFNFCVAFWVSAEQGSSPIKAHGKRLPIRPVAPIRVAVVGRLRGAGGTASQGGPRNFIPDGGTAQALLPPGPGQVTARARHTRCSAGP